MFPAIKSAHFTDKLQALLPEGVEGRAVYQGGGVAIGLGIVRGNKVAKVSVLSRIIKRNPDKQLRIAAEFLLQRLEISDEREPGTSSRHKRIEASAIGRSPGYRC